MSSSHVQNHDCRCFAAWVQRPPIAAGPRSMDSQSQERLPLLQHLSHAGKPGHTASDSHSSLQHMGPCHVKGQTAPAFCVCLLLQ